jgi:pantetheine-phosphate adenylyltransferase
VKNNIGIFPGSFDPITVGHKHVILKAAEIVETLIVGIGFNSTKKNYFSIEKREKWVKSTFTKYPNIIVKKYEGLTVEFAKKENAQFIFRGLRSSIDFEYEKKIAESNLLINEKIETIFLLSSNKYGMISSSIVREIFKNGGNIDKFIPNSINISEP